MSSRGSLAKWIFSTPKILALISNWGQYLQIPFGGSKTVEEGAELYFTLHVCANQEGFKKFHFVVIGPGNKPRAFSKRTSFEIYSDFHGN